MKAMFIKNPIPEKDRSLFFACMVAYMGAISFGYMIGYSSPALPNMINEGQLTQDEASYFASFATFGALFGCPIAGMVIDKLGRKQTLLASSLPFLLGWFLIWFSSSNLLLYIGRILTGIGSGMTCVSSPLFVAEISPKEYRGFLGSGVQLGVTIGIMLVYALGIVLSWQMLAAVGSLLAVITVALVLQVQDTPRYLLMKGDRAGAIRCLLWLREPGADVEGECNEMEQSLPSKDDKFAYSEFRKPELYKPLKVAVVLMFFQQFSGINVVMFYSVTIFQSAGLKEYGEIATMGLGCVQVIATYVACILMDKAGRKQLLFVSSIGMAVTCFAFGYYYRIVSNDSSKVDSYSWIAFVSLVLYIVAFAIGWGPIPMLVMSEVFPVRARGAGSAIATAANWIFAFIITKEFPFFIATFGSAFAFFGFGVFCVLAVVFVLFTVPETKGKSLEVIELFFSGRIV